MVNESVVRMFSNEATSKVSSCVADQVQAEEQLAAVPMLISGKGLEQTKQELGRDFDLEGKGRKAALSFCPKPTDL